ncbi:hypothetical protein ACOME3_004204 [Neoechinorhynchus agilis]
MTSLKQTPLCGLSKSVAVCHCTLLAIAYVASLYIWKDRFCDRNNPSVIRKRFMSAFSVCLIATVLTSVHLLTVAYKFDCREDDGWFYRPIYIQMGLRLNGILEAIIVSSILCTVLFTGPIIQTL